MKLLEIKLQINLLEPKQVELFKNLLDSISNGEPKKEAKPEPKKEAKPEPKKEAKPEPKKEAKGVTADDLRAELAKKVMQHREEIKDKLTELDAPNVTSLDPDNYVEFMDFLTGLK